MRVVSLVPSLTETLFALGLGPDEVVGRTPWCVRPADQVAEVPVVGGTKTPNLRRIAELAPDFVLLDREENRRETFEALEAAGIRCWVSDVVRAEQVPGLLEGLGDAVGRGEAGRALANEARAALGEADVAVPGVERWIRALPLIWRDPLMALAPTRYGGELVVRAGFRVPDLDPGEGYPRVTPERLAALGLDVLLLSSEPHDFSEAEGVELADAVAAKGGRRPRPVKVDGQALTWFGAHTAAGLRYFLKLRRGLESLGAVAATSSR